MGQLKFEREANRLSIATRTYITKNEAVRSRRHSYTLADEQMIEKRTIPEVNSLTAETETL